MERKIHTVTRGTYSVGGFANTDRSGGHEYRVRPAMDADVRLMVKGQRCVGFGITAVDADQHRNLGPGLGTAPGPYVGAFGLAAVIDNHGGSGAEIAKARADGLLIEAEVGDALLIDGNLWTIDWFRRGSFTDYHNIVLTLEGPAPEPEPHLAPSEQTFPYWTARLSTALEAVLNAPQSASAQRVARDCLNEFKAAQAAGLHDSTDLLRS